MLLSPSNAALKESAVKTVSAIAVKGEDEESGHMSDVRLKSPLYFCLRLLTTAFHSVRSRLTLLVYLVEPSVCRTSQPSQP